jgi:hypothetical protein
MAEEHFGGKVKRKHHFSVRIEFWTAIGEATCTEDEYL